MMLQRSLLTVTVLAAALAAGSALPAAAEPVSMVFIHHSSGRNLLAEGSVRAHLAAAADEAGMERPRLWDHDYNAIGLSNPDGTKLNYGWDIPNDNTDPIGLHELFTTDNAARDSILSRFDVIAFKSCYEPTCAIGSDAQLQQYKDWYLEIRDVLDQHPDKVFVIMSMPALFIDRNSTSWSDRSRNFANWLGSEEFLGGRANLVYFDLFDLIANPDDGSDTRNMQRPEYRRNPEILDSHPNELANQVVGPLFARALVNAAAVDTKPAGWGSLKAGFR
jgi:hypothetical protein